MLQVILKLEEMNYQLKNVNSTSERLIIMNMTEEITKDIIRDGYSILERAPEANVRFSMILLTYSNIFIFQYTQ